MLNEGDVFFWDDVHEFLECGGVDLAFPYVSCVEDECVEYCGDVEISNCRALGVFFQEM